MDYVFCIGLCMCLLGLLMIVNCCVRNAEPVERLKKGLTLFFERMTAIVNACSEKNKVCFFVILNFLCVSCVHLDYYRLVLCF